MIRWFVHSIVKKHYTTFRRCECGHAWHDWYCGRGWGRLLRRRT